MAYLTTWKPYKSTKHVGKYAIIPWIRHGKWSQKMQLKLHESMGPWQLIKVKGTDTLLAMKIHKVEIHIDSTKTKTQKKNLTLLQEKKHHFPLNLDTPLSKLLRKQLSQEKNKKTHFDTILWVYDPKKKRIIKTNRCSNESNKKPRSSIGGQSLVADSSLAQFVGWILLEVMLTEELVSRCCVLRFF